MLVPHLSRFSKDGNSKVQMPNGAESAAVKQAKVLKSSARADQFFPSQFQSSFSIHAVLIAAAVPSGAEFETHPSKITKG
jgi:hypothetical protein